MGLLDIDTSFIFIAEDVNGTSTLIRDIILQSSDKIKTHTNVLVLELKANDVIFKSYNKYRKKNGALMVKRNVLSPDSPTDIFPAVNSLKGKKLRLIHALFAHYIQATFLPDGGQPNKRLTGQNGLIPDYLTIFAEHYGASVEFLNPEPIFDYGGILEDGSWSGQVRMLWDDMGDTSCELAYNYPFRQIMTGHGFGDPEYLSFASPKYALKSKTFALLKPFNLLLWLWIVATILSIPVVFYLLGLKYHTSLNMPPVQIFNELMWFSFSIFMGEVKVSDIKIIPFT